MSDDKLDLMSSLPYDLGGRDGPDSDQPANFPTHEKPRYDLGRLVAAFELLITCLASDCFGEKAVKAENIRSLSLLVVGRCLEVARAFDEAESEQPAAAGEEGKNE